MTAGIGLEALPPVRKAIGSGFEAKTITLSCGKLTTGITVVGKYATVPAGVLLGRNVRVDALATAEDYDEATVVASGRTIGHPVHHEDEA